MRKYLFTSLIIALMAVGCGEKEPPPPPEREAPPPPTAQQIHSEFRSAAQPLWAQMGGGFASDEQMKAVPAALRSLKSRNTAQENGPEAIGRFQKELEQLVLNSKEAGRWRLVRYACLAHKAMQPQSERFDRILAQAEIIVARPVVKIKGFAEPGGVGDEVSILLTVTDPNTKVQTNYNIKVGQSFHPGIDPNGRPINLLKAIRVVGNSTLELEYLPISQLWTVSLKR